jgi:hypothetical protein
MEQIVRVTLHQQADGRVVARCLQPRLSVVADSEDEALEQLQEELA